MKGLSAAQRHVLDRMADGWELGHDQTMRGRCWMQKGGIGRGGESETVSNATVSALYQRRLIRTSGRDFPTERFELAVPA